MATILVLLPDLGAKSRVTPPEKASRQSPTVHGCDLQSLRLEGESTLETDGGPAEDVALRQW